MAEANGVVDEGFLRRYRQLLDAEDAAFDELEHAHEDGDRAQYDHEFAQWRSIVERRLTFLERHGLLPLQTRA
jgi:UDP:flavonoid glycosyltransferase YjiC (YdhE family)